MFIRFTRHGIRRDMHRSFQSPMMEQVSPVQTGNKPVSPVQMNKKPEPVSPVQMNKRLEPVSPVQKNRRPEPVSPVQMNKIPEPISPVETGTNPNLAAYARRPRFYRGRR